MFGILAILFLALPIVEIYIIIQVGAVVGGWNTVALMILISVVGAWLVRREGLHIIAKVQRQLGQGSLPAKELVDGLLVALAGALMLTPGFLTDALGLLLLLPPSRAVIRTMLIHRFRNRVTLGGAFSAPPSTGSGFGTIYDVGDVEYDQPDDNLPDPSDELGP